MEKQVNSTEGRLIHNLVSPEHWKHHGQGTAELNVHDRCP